MPEPLSVMYQILPTMLGGILAALSGIAVAFYLENRRQNLLAKLLRIAICDDLRHAITLYDRIADDWEKTQRIWYETTKEFFSSRATYEKNQDFKVVFDDERLRKEIFQYYMASARDMNLLDAMQRRRDELLKMSQDAMREIRIQNPTWSHSKVEETLQAYISKYAKSENEEFHRMETLIPDAVQRLKVHRTTAQSLLDKLDTRQQG